MVSPIFNLLDCEILPKRKEIFDKYCKIIRWGRANPTRFIEDFFKLQLTDMQKYVLMSSWIPANVVWLMGRNSRKCLSLDTPVYFKVKDRGNKYEKKNVGELQVGDLIYDADGLLTEVIHLNPVIIEDGYEVEFEDGEKILCNAEHLWYVRDVNFDKNNRYEDKMVERSTDFIYTHFKDRFKKKDGFRDFRFYVPITKPIQYPDIQYLPIPPYALGVWLGDGNSHDSGITSANYDCEEMKQHLLDCGVKSVFIQKPKGRDTISTLYLDRKKEIDKDEDLNREISQTFIKKLRFLGVFNNKHIPERYMYGTVQERLELLQRLMDTDGTVDNRNGNCSFSRSRYELCVQVQQLLASLGIKATITEKKMKYVKQDGTLAKSWEVFFTTGKDFPCFKLKRKFDLLKDTRSQYQLQKAIVNVTKTGRKIPMRCITVSNHSGLFLCGNNYTVTHNSYLVTPFMMARALLLPNTNTYIMAPSGGQAQGTFTKLEDLAKGNIASVIGVSSVFLDECVRMNSTADPFTHAKQSYSVELYNGSTINTLNSVIKNIVGIRSNFSEKTLTFIEICQKNNFFNCWKILKLNKLQHSFERSKCECDESRKNCLDDSWLNPKNCINR